MRLWTGLALRKEWCGGAAGVSPPDVDLAGVGLAQLASHLKMLSSARELLVSRYLYLLIIDAA